MLEQEKKMLVEPLGIRFEQYGLPPMAGRIFGCLVLADPPYLTFDEIRECLDASKSTISTNLNFLMQGDCLIDYLTLPGDRKRYFRINSKKWLQKIQDFPKDMEMSNELLTEIIHFREENGMTPFPDVDKLKCFHDFITHKLKGIMEEWEIYYANQQQTNK